MPRLILLLALVVGEFACFETPSFRANLHQPVAGDAIFHGALGAPAAEPLPGSPRRRRQGDSETL